MSPEDTKLLWKIIEAKTEWDLLRASKRARFAAQRKSGMSYHEIGRYWGVSATYIYNEVNYR